MYSWGREREEAFQPEGYPAISRNTCSFALLIHGRRKGITMGAKSPELNCVWITEGPECQTKEFKMCGQKEGLGFLNRGGWVLMRLGRLIWQ